MRLPAQDRDVFTVASCNYIFRQVDTFQDFADHVREVLDAGREVDLVVLPELLSMELMTALPTWPDMGLPGLAETRVWADDVAELFRAEAADRGQYILGGSHLWDGPEGLRNRAQLFGPNGLVLEHCKTHLFPAEFMLGITEGEAMEAVDLPFVRTAINTCYEAEIPECAASVTEQGAQLILAPSLTFSEAGFWRVRHCVQARCIENQVFMIHSCVGGVPIGPFPGAFARSSICSPCDVPWPPNGVLAEAGTNTDSIAVATIDLESLRVNRERGAATTFRDRRRRTDLYHTWPTHLINEKE